MELEVPTIVPHTLTLYCQDLNNIKSSHSKYSTHFKDDFMSVDFTDLNASDQ